MQRYLNPVEQINRQEGVMKSDPYRGSILLAHHHVGGVLKRGINPGKHGQGRKGCDEIRPVQRSILGIFVVGVEERMRFIMDEEAMNKVTANQNQWDEESSATFLDLGEIFVPGRAQQTQALLELIPARSDEVFTIVELAAGGGILAKAILERFPACHYVALDGSEMMREQMARRLAAYGDRLTIAPFLLEERRGGTRCLLHCAAWCPRCACITSMMSRSERFFMICSSVSSRVERCFWRM